MLKRVFDFVAALMALLLLAPVIVGVALLVRLRLGRPVLFSQPRPGRHGRPFRMYKFRSMNSACDAQGVLLPDAQRLTRFGLWLRASSLDELPGLWSVLRGDMSLVGPRPLLIQYLPRYSSRQARRHEVRPGITGWAQVNGLRGETDTLDKMQKRVEYDLYYIENLSLWLDLKIIVATVFKGFINKNAY